MLKVVHGALNFYQYPTLCQPELSIKSAPYHQSIPHIYIFENTQLTTNIVATNVNMVTEKMVGFEQ
jgi:hypothetical protein